MIYAIDFDGTLCSDAYPEIGEPRRDVIEFVKNGQAIGDRFILWTCRGENRLAEAVAWCAERGIKFDAVNENLPELVALYGNDCRKVNADRYIDDRALGLDEIKRLIRETRRSCENCGNIRCASGLVAFYYDECVESRYTKHWRPKEPPKENEGEI